MNKLSIPMFAASIVFVGVAFSIYAAKQVSLATFLTFFVFGFASGCFLVAGILFATLPKKGQGKA